MAHLENAYSLAPTRLEAQVFEKPSESPTKNSTTRSLFMILPKVELWSVSEEPYPFKNTKPDLQWICNMQFCYPSHSLNLLLNTLKSAIIVIYRSPGGANTEVKSSRKSSTHHAHDDVHTDLSGHSMLAKLQPNLHVRRKSSPAITGLDSRTLSHLQSSHSHAKKRHSHAQAKPNSEQLFVKTPSASQIASRRLSSPPSLEKDHEDFFFSHHVKNRGRKDCDAEMNGSNSGSGSSLHKLSISGLNPSSSDLRANTIISGHQVQKFAEIGYNYALLCRNFRLHSVRFCKELGHFCWAFSNSEASLF